MKLSNKVVYQIYPKSFLDTNGDGIGDFKGVISKLDYLKDLGIDVIWFNAMFVSPQKDNGYDVQDYRQINPVYGSMEDFEKLCVESKKRGIDIMLDMVFNHTSTEHVWFKKALQNDPKYKNYYIFKKGKEDGSAPTNWNSKFGGPAWEYVESLNEWYLHLFDVTQADLNWENPDVRKEMADIVNYWREKGVHGFRFDVVNLISKDKYEDDPNEFDGRQYYTDGPKVHQYIQELNKASFGNDPDSITVGEMSSTTLENCVKYAGKENNELSMVFTFHHLKVDYKNQQKWNLMPFDFEELKRLINTWQIGMQEANAWNALFLNNHDQPRAISRFCDDKKYHYESATMLATFVHMMRGTPYIYQGEEIGMTNAYFTDIEQYRDVESLNAYNILKADHVDDDEIIHILQERSRDNSRTPMQWDDSENSGFTSGTPWISVNKNYKTINVKASLESEKSIFKYYKELIQLRKENEVIQEGMYVPYDESNTSIFGYKRIFEGAEILVLCNFYGETATVQLDGNYKLVLSNYASKTLETNLQMNPYEACVLIKEK